MSDVPARVGDAHAHVATVRLSGPPQDVAAIGGAVTLALCGHWEHDPPCPLAPHHTAVRSGDDDTPVRVRVLYACRPGDRPVVVARIEAALAAGRAPTPSGQEVRWELLSCTSAPIDPGDAAHAARLVTLVT